MGKLIANADAVLSYRSPVTGASPSFVTPPSIKLKAGGKGVRLNNAQILIPLGLTDGTCTTLAPMNANIPATALKVKSEFQLVLRVDDEITVSIPGIQSGGPPPPPCNLSVTVYISNAGQAVVTGE